MPPPPLYEALLCMKICHNIYLAWLPHSCLCYFAVEIKKSWDGAVYVTLKFHEHIFGSVKSESHHSAMHKNVISSLPDYTFPMEAAKS